MNGMKQPRGNMSRTPHKIGISFAYFLYVC